MGCCLVVGTDGVPEGCTMGCAGCTAGHAAVRVRREPVQPLIFDKPPVKVRTREPEVDPSSIADAGWGRPCLVQALP